MAEQLIDMPEPDGTDMKITLKVRKFIEHYARTGHGTKSAIFAGYAENSAAVTASRLLKKANIVAEIAEEIKALTKKYKVDSDWVKNQAVLLHQRAVLNAPVIDASGEVVEGVGYDPNTAHKALKMVGEHKDVMAFDNTIKHIGDPDAPIGVEHLNKTDRAARIAEILKQALVEHDKSKGKNDD